VADDRDDGQRDPGDSSWVRLEPPALALVAALSLPFVLVSAWVTWDLARLVWRSVEVRSWTKVEAQITYVELGPRPRHSGRPNPVLHVEYEYMRNGAPHHGNTTTVRQLSTFDSTWFFNDAEEAWVSELREDRDRRRALTCLVDPSDPERSVLAPVEWYGWLTALAVWFVFRLGIGIPFWPLLYLSVASLIPRWRRAQGWPE
jgi:Protein of unknown function (DUF3592)